MSEIVKKVVRLLAEVLVSGKGCPVCGGDKTEKAKTCRKCITEIGTAATLAVDKVTDAAYNALIGNTMANAGNVVRGTVWGPYLANARIDMDAQFHPAEGKIGAYWHCKRGVPGGFVSIFVFGDNLKQGDTVCGLTELKVKFVPTYPDKQKRPVHYVRLQVVEGIKSDMRLAILDTKQIDRMRWDYLPVSLIRNNGFDVAVGFLPVKTRPDGEDDAE